MRMKIEERDASGKTVAKYESVRAAADALGIATGTIIYSVKHAGHVVRKTQTSFYAVDDEVSRCETCVYREYYNIDRQRIGGCGYILKTGLARGCSHEDCTKWEEDVYAQSRTVSR